MSRERGFEIEQKARQYLEIQGLVWLCSNYQCRLGEIDLIMRDGVYLVFVEVRARSADRFGHALESITKSKQQKILKTAQCYLKAKRLHDKHPIRFDVVAMQGPALSTTWIKNAFDGFL